MADGIWFTSHINENRAEVAKVAELFPDARDYLDTYDRHGLVTERTRARAQRPPQRRRARRGWPRPEPGRRTARPATPRWAAGCSRLRRHVEHGVGVALGSDIGAGTGLFLPKEALQAYFMQQLLGDGRACR